MKLESILKLLDPDVITAAAQSPLGILALMVILLCIVVFYMIGRDSPIWARLSVFLVLVAAIGLFAVGVISKPVNKNIIRFKIAGFIPDGMVPNVRHSDFKITAFTRGEGGKVEELKIETAAVNPGSIVVRMQAPDGNKPFFLVIKDPENIWSTRETILFDVENEAEWISKIQ